jgi:hypothetical protein
MPDHEKTIVPLYDAHAALSAFGIGPSSKGYLRWRRPDGFCLVDLEVVLGESQYILRVDCREWMQDAMNTIQDQLTAIGVSATSDLGEEGEQGFIEIEGKQDAIKFVPNDDDDFDTVVQSINTLISTKGRYRKFRTSEGSDGWAYGLLSNGDWKELESNAPELVTLLFMPD